MGVIDLKKVRFSISDKKGPIIILNPSCFGGYSSVKRFSITEHDPDL